MRHNSPLLFAEPDHKLCPVCRKRTYSLAGVHPKCALENAYGSQRDQLLCNPA
jgi:hypothetical protein